MTTDGHNLIVDTRVKKDMLDLAPLVQKRVGGFLLHLAANPYSPEILRHAVQPKKDFYYYQLQSGCYVFWEIVQGPIQLSIESLEGTIVRVLGVGFDFPKGFHKLSF
jgi:hypothetical protein